MDKIITPKATQVKLRFRIKVSWKNGANETIHSETPPNVSPITPIFMDFRIKDGLMRHINMTEVRALDIEAYRDSGLIT